MASYKVATRAELVPGGKKLVEVDGRAIAVFHCDGAYYAIDDVCTHDGGPLAEGELMGCEIRCPRHGARFDVRTGPRSVEPGKGAGGKPGRGGARRRYLRGDGGLTRPLMRGPETPREGEPTSPVASASPGRPRPSRHREEPSSARLGR